MNDTKTSLDSIFKKRTCLDACGKNFCKGLCGSIVNSRDIVQRVNEMMKELSNPDNDAIIKIKISNFLCNKLYDIYKLSLDRRNVIIDELESSIYNGTELLVPIRLYYFRFRNEIVSYNVSCKLFKNNIYMHMDSVPYFQILKYILKSYLLDKEIETDILNKFEEIFVDNNTTTYIKMEIADIFILNKREERGNEMLAIVRELERIEVERREQELGIQLSVNQGTVYGDSQNVHSSNINTSVLNACIHLIKKQQTTEFNPSEVLEELVSISTSIETKTNINTVLQRIEIDQSKFSVGDNTFGLYVIFASLWSYIKQHSSFEELKLRLIEEMESMALYCTTGHVSRLINVIQGYTDDEELMITISDYEQIKAVISVYLDKELMTAPENIVDAMIENNKTLFYDFIVLKMNKKIPDIIETYGDVQKHIVSSIKTYTKYNYWNIIDNVLTKESDPLVPKEEKQEEKKKFYHCICS